MWSVLSVRPWANSAAGNNGYLTHDRFGLYLYFLLPVAVSAVGVRFNCHCGDPVGIGLPLCTGSKDKFEVAFDTRCQRPLRFRSKMGESKGVQN